MELQLDESAVRQANEDVLKELEGVKAEISTEQDAISALERRRRSLWEDDKRAQSQLALLSELHTRFSLLNDQYRSDLARLEAISEAGVRLAQMPPEEMARSCATEALKIQSLIEDLSETSKSNDFQIKAKTEYAQRINAELIAANNTIKDELQP